MDKALKICEEELQEPPRIIRCPQTLNHLIRCLIKYERLDQALNILDQHMEWQQAVEFNSDFGLQEEPKVLNLTIFATMIKSYCTKMLVEEAIKLFSKMKEFSYIKADESFYNTLLEGCAKTDHLD